MSESTKNQQLPGNELFDILCAGLGGAPATVRTAPTMTAASFVSA